MKVWILVSLLIISPPSYSLSVEVLGSFVIDFIRIKMHLHNKETFKGEVYHISDSNNPFLREAANALYGDQWHDTGVWEKEDTTFICPISINGDLNTKYCIEDIEVYTEYKKVIENS